MTVPEERDLPIYMQVREYERREVARLTLTTQEGIVAMAGNDATMIVVNALRESMAGGMNG